MVTFSALRITLAIISREYIDSIMEERCVFIDWSRKNDPEINLFTEHYISRIRQARRRLKQRLHSITRKKGWMRNLVFALPWNLTAIHSDISFLFDLRNADTFLLLRKEHTHLTNTIRKANPRIISIAIDSVPDAGRSYEMKPIWRESERTDSISVRSSGNERHSFCPALPQFPEWLPEAVSVSSQHLFDR